MEPEESEGESDIDAEWEDVEGPTQPGGAGGLEIVVPTHHGGHKGKGKGKCLGMAGFLEKALASFHRELRLQLHKVHLLCLLARGMLLSQQCDNPNLQSVLLSMLAASARQLGVPEDASEFSKVVLLKLVKWFCQESSHLRAAVRGVQSQVGGALESQKGVWPGVGGVSESQLLVSLLRSLGLRSRLVMVLHPLPLKTPMQGNGGRKGKGASKKGKGRGKKVGPEGASDDGGKDTGEIEEGDGFGERLLQYNLQKGSLGSSETSSLAEGEDSLPEGTGRCSGRGSKLGKARSGNRKQKGNFGFSSGQKRMRGKGRKRYGEIRTCSGELASPYFANEGAEIEGSKSTAKGGTWGSGGPPKKKTKTSCRSTGASTIKAKGRRAAHLKKSPSPEFVVEEEEDDDNGDNGDDDFVVRRKRRGRSSKATPSKKLKKAMADMAGQASTKPKSRSSSVLSSSPSSLCPPSSSLSSRRPPSSSTPSLPLSSSLSSPSSSLSSRPPPSSSAPSLPPSFSPLPSPSSSLSSHCPPSSSAPSLFPSSPPSSPLSSSAARTAELAILAPAEVEVLDTGNWVEVMSPGLQRWWCVHTPSCSIDQPQLCEKYCTVPLRYVVAFENKDTVRDVTPLYASDWCTDARRQRVSQSWWEESLRPYQPDNLMETIRENEAIFAKLKSQPLPLTISEYKNHPLYVLRRHLLKFEAIYPEDSEVLGHCKGESVYARSNVHMLHTRETWLKEGRSVKVAGKAYRVVKARPKKGQSSLESRDNTVEVFGRWQTEEYMPRLVVDGQVPRNEYGNVEMFKPSMLPVGGAHIKIQGIHRVARKLNIDFAPAMIGWDFHGGHTHPMFDGIVVAKEMEEVLLEAWETEEQLQLEKEVKKREKRVVERWRNLVRGVVIRDRVRDKFKNINS